MSKQRRAKVDDRRLRQRRAEALAEKGTPAKVAKLNEWAKLAELGAHVHRELGAFIDPARAAQSYMELAELFRREAAELQDTLREDARAITAAKLVVDDGCSTAAATVAAYKFDPKTPTETIADTAEHGAVRRAVAKRKQPTALQKLQAAATELTHPGRFAGRRRA